MTKRAKRFRKKLMSTGVGRNVANYLVQQRSVGLMTIVAGIVTAPGFVSITGVAKVRCASSIPNIRTATAFRVKRFAEE